MSPESGAAPATSSVTASGRARPADRRARLISHATGLFLEKGYSQVSMADIARAAGVTAPALYRHFADKQDTLAAAVLAGVEDLEACTDAALAPRADGTAPSRDQIVDTIAGLAVHRPDAAVLWRWNSDFLSDKQNVEVARRTRAVLTRWADALLHDRPELQSRTCEQLAWAILSVTGSLTVHGTRIPASRARAMIAATVVRLLELDPTDIPPLADSPIAHPSPAGRRDEIMDAASDLFRLRGFADVGVDEIGAAVGISGPSVYKHFSNKAEILLSISRRNASRLDATVIAAYSQTSDPADRLRALVDSYVQVLTATPDLTVSFSNRAALHDVPAAADLVTVQRTYVRRWIDLYGLLHPELTEAERAVSVHAALTIVNDAMRVRRNWRRVDDGVLRGAQISGTLAYLAKGALGIAS
ncbi:TetR/AcrR family transcriptional regulator [Jongsikchunia kroppenstedtii]|uniref:TetR/AcrR family transcriptional regulator n=1 Tax=Jongsikchunia kroppenstedtii TaxID=1121721 RepID=UPI0003622D06|nr:TetR/AcrR family transcriptional regulator [Jongsikchunia kroppenstedtii]